MIFALKLAKSLRLPIQLTLLSKQHINYPHKLKEVIQSYRPTNLEHAVKTLDYIFTMRVCQPFIKGRSTCQWPVNILNKCSIESNN
jgi:hypothetical protein